MHKDQRGCHDVANQLLHNEEACTSMYSSEVDLEPIYSQTPPASFKQQYSPPERRQGSGGLDVTRSESLYSQAAGEPPSKEIRIGYALCEGGMTLITAFLLVSFHVAMITFRLVAFSLSKTNIYCDIVYPPALRVRMEEGGQLLGDCEILQNVISFYQSYLKLVDAYPHYLVGKYYCPTLQAICTSATSGDHPVDCDLQEFSMSSVLVACSILFDSTTFSVDVSPDKIANNEFAPEDTDESDCYRLDMVTIDSAVCPDLYDQIENRDVDDSLYIFYGIEPWFGNNILEFWRSFSFRQMNGQMIDERSDELTICGSMQVGNEFRRQIKRAGSPSFQVVPRTLVTEHLIQGIEILHPCGVKPTSVFTDTFDLFQ
eukprot:GHVH01007682.1.p1 GENE.GHVH01007682.1~~GHVH01007682.1.p1  ORF type:complete len:372 (+),score=51.32 GHVH01007682.1:21-1136(+)